MPEPHKSGYVALVGKPNAGKSTLMNAILGQKLSIVTHKAQTTRHQIKGIRSEDNAQIIFLDTPGVIKPTYHLQKAMMQFVERARGDADIILLIVGLDDHSLPEYLFQLLEDIHKPVILVLNKSDLGQKSDLKEVMDNITTQFDFAKHMAVSSTKRDNLDELIDQVIDLLPPGPPFYPKDQLSDNPVRFFVSELIREEIFLLYHQEIPYSTTVEVIEYQEREDINHIFAEIIVNAESQKGILIGKGGKAIKRLGSRARKKVESFIDKKIYLDLHVKVRPKWRNNENMVRSLGY